MPTYEYVCQSCGTDVEVYQRFSDAPLSECGVCGGPLRKVFHPAGILFKGSGFYVTDSRGKGREKGGESSDGGTGDKAVAKSEGKGKSDTKSDGKSDAKAEGASGTPASKQSKTPKASKERTA